MSLRTALPHTAPRPTRTPDDRLTGDTGTPLYLGGVLVVAFLAALVWICLF